MAKPVILIGDTQRQYAKNLIDQADKGDVVRISKPTRSSLQNDLMWALIDDIMKHPSNERPHWDANAWKAGLMQLFGFELKWDQGLGDCGPLPLGYRTSKMTVRQMSDFIEFIYKYGAEHGVQFNDQRSAA